MSGNLARGRALLRIAFETATYSASPQSATTSVNRWTPQARSADSKNSSGGEAGRVEAKPTPRPGIPENPVATVPAPVHPRPVPSTEFAGVDGAPGPFRKVPTDFFDRDTTRMARELLGLWVVRRVDGHVRVGRIVETEAYLGPHDLASHSSKGRTRRNQSMFGPPGHAYVYLIYGLHHCLNVVTGPEGHGAAVLLRALEPIHGIEGNTRGPGLLCRALAVDRSLDGVDLRGDTLFLAQPETREPIRVTRTPRVGVDYAGAWAKRLLRFHVRDNAWVSRG
jgi:DNA-3-methyladenine glycosylase